jgi:GTPase SAR1 family protein
MLRKTDFKCNENVLPQTHSVTDFMYFTLVLVGAPGCGKTSLIRSYFIDDGDDFSHGETVGSRLLRCTKWHKGIRINCLIWELSGRERFRWIIPMFLSSAMAVVFCYNPWEKFLMEHNRSLLQSVIQNVDKRCVVAVASTMEDMQGRWGGYFQFSLSEVLPFNNTGSWSSNNYEYVTARMTSLTDPVTDLKFATSSKTNKNTQELFSSLFDRKVSKSEFTIHINSIQSSDRKFGLANAKWSQWRWV